MRIRIASVLTDAENDCTAGAWQVFAGWMNE
jgi:hypothetical protein